MIKQAKELAKAFYRAKGYYPLNKFGQQYKLDPYHIPLWRWIGRDGWERETFVILDRYLAPDSVYCDLGAWIGTTSVLCASTRCKKIVCLEPDAAAFRFLQWNIELNEIRNITPFNFALSDRTGCAHMAPFHGTRGDSTSSLIHADALAKGTQVLTVSWSDFLQWSGIEKIDFLKIDIEGGEFELLPSIKAYLDQYKPTIYLSTHAPYLPVNERKAAMEKIAQSLQSYKTCRDANLNKIGFDALTAPAALNGFRSFVFE